MSKKYHDIMEHVQVTSDIKERVLKNIRHENIQKTKIVSFPLKPLIALAACLVVLMVGITQLPFKDQDHQGTTIVSPIEKLASIDDLSIQIGFDVPKLKDFPGNVTRISYSLIDGKLAQVEYSLEQGTIIFRMAKGSEDVSGNYMQFEKTMTESVNGVDVKLSSNNDVFYLANWTQGNYSYSVSVVDEDQHVKVTKSEMLKMIETVIVSH